MIIGVLWLLSNNNDGIVSVPDTPTSFLVGLRGVDSALLWTYALLWTIVPVWAMTLYTAFYTAMLNSLMARQPTVELMKPTAGRERRCATCEKDHGRTILPCFAKKDHRNNRLKKDKSTAKLTLLLDYNKYWPVINSFHAFANRHFLVAVCMFIKVALSLMSGLSAAILSVASIPANATVTVNFNSYFDEWAPSSKSTRPALDIVSANLINGGLPFSWTIQNYSFLPFHPPAGSSSGNLTGDTLAYSSSLDCDIFSSEELIKAGGVTLSGNPGGNNSITVVFNFTDRGCPIEKWINVFPTQYTYGQTWTVTGCSVDVDRGRFGIITGEYDESAPFLLTNFTLLSCVPYFWNSTASVTVVSNNNGSAEVVGFSISMPMRWWPGFWETWLVNIPYYRTYDPEQTFPMDDLANLAYNYAVIQNSSYPFDTNLIATSFQIVYSSVFATFASTSAYLPSTQTHNSPGTVLTLQNRLFVVTQPAIAIIVIVGVALITTIWVAYYVTDNRDRLMKSLDLILGHAILVDGSPDVSRYIAQVKIGVIRDGASVEKSDLVEYAEKTTALSEWECWLDNGKVRLRRPGAGNASEESRVSKEPVLTGCFF